eukprot:2005057-Rhodomonas_salina.1
MLPTAACSTPHRSRQINIFPGQSFPDESFSRSMLSDQSRSCQINPSCAGGCLLGPTPSRAGETNGDTPLASSERGDAKLRLALAW